MYKQIYDKSMQVLYWPNCERWCVCNIV